MYNLVEHLCFIFTSDFELIQDNIIAFILEKENNTHFLVDHGVMDINFYNFMLELGF